MDGGRVIYLDNAATTMRKPQPVIDAVVEAMGSVGNAGRGAAGAAMDAARIVYECRERVAKLFGCPRADHVAFTPNSTAALNYAIAGLVHEGDRVITTSVEHNSVLRPLNRVAGQCRIKLEHADADELGRLDMDDLLWLISPGTKVVVVTGASNVTGDVVDVARVGQRAHEVGALVILDASQSAGLVPINMVEQGIDVVCFTGHKALMGPQGTGGLAVADGVDIPPYNVGGTGVHSFDPNQPLGWPTRLEAGTLNAHGLAGLRAAIDFISEQGGVEIMAEHELAMARLLYEGVKDVEGVKVYGGWGELEEGEPHTGIVTLNVRDMPSADVSDMLMQGWGIATRPGAHCAPLVHEAMGTREQGAVRFSTSWFTTPEEIAVAVSAIRVLAEE